MTEIKNIKGYWDMSHTNNFNNNDMWEGKLLLEEDGWFEGIVVDPNSPYKKDRFIFGIYHPNKVMELFKITPLEVSYPFVFHGTKTDEGYDGHFEVIGIFGTMPCGVSHIVTHDMDVEKENLDSEINKLKSKIQSYKEHDMDIVGQSFYANTIRTRNSLAQIILRRFENRGFTTEETQQIMEECQPVNETIKKATEDEAKKLVKKIPKNFFESNESDLPF